MACEAHGIQPNPAPSSWGPWGLRGTNTLHQFHQLVDYLRAHLEILGNSKVLPRCFQGGFFEKLDRHPMGLLTIRFIMWKYRKAQFVAHMETKKAP